MHTRGVGGVGDRGCCSSYEVKRLNKFITAAAATRGVVPSSHIGVGGVIGPMIVENPFEDMTSDVHGRLIRKLLMGVVINGAHFHALEHRRRAHVGWEAAD